MSMLRQLGTGAKHFASAVRGPLVANLLLAAAFGGIGIALLVTSHAATPVASIEPENGALSSTATHIADTTASGGAAVKFNAGTSAAATCPAFPQFPSASCTGTDGTPLTVVTGDQTISTAGTVIENKDIHGYLNITAKNVVVRNSIIRGGASRCASKPAGQGNNGVVWVQQSGSATLDHIEIIPDNPSACLDGIWAYNTTISNADIHGTTDGVKAYDNVVVQDSYIHDLAYNTSDPNQGNKPTHNDDVQTYEANSNISLIHNSLDNGATGNAAYIITQDGGQPAVNMLVKNNIIKTGGCSVALQRKVGPEIVHQLSVIDNYFYHGYNYDCPIWLDNSPNGLLQNSGNVWADTHQPIPAPIQ